MDERDRRPGGAIDRRALLRGACGAAAAAVVAGGTGRVRADEPAPQPIIDTHQHFWDLKRFRLPWLDGAGDVLNRTHTIEDYRKAAEGLNVVRAVYMEVAVDAAQRADEAEYVINLCRQSTALPTIAAVVAGATEREDFGPYIDRFKDSPFVKGVRSSFDAGRASEHYVKNLQRLGAAGLRYDINTGPAGLEPAAEIAKRCPDTRFVLDHCGNVDPALFRRNNSPPSGRDMRTQWERGIATLAACDNVMCKISGVLESGEPGRAGDGAYAAVVGFCLDQFGPDRVMFGSNWPVVNRGGSFAGWVQLLRSILMNRPEIQSRKLFHDNALRFYALG